MSSNDVKRKIYYLCYLYTYIHTYIHNDRLMQNYRDTHHTYNLRRDVKDDQDQYMTSNLKLNESDHLVRLIDHRLTCPPVYFQGDCWVVVRRAFCVVSFIIIYSNSIMMKSFSHLDYMFTLTPET